MNDNLRRKVSKLTLQLQSQTTIPHWSLIENKLTYYHAKKQPIKWGKKGRMVNKLMKIANFFHLADMLIFGVGVIKILHIYARCDFSRDLGAHYEKIFSGFGAGAEEELYLKYVSNNKKNVLRIDWGTLTGVGAFGRPSIAKTLFMLFSCSFGHAEKIKKESLVAKENTIDLLTVAALNIGEYAFFREFFNIAWKHGVREVASVAMSVSTCACIDEKPKVTYIQHGLMSVSLLFLNVDKAFLQYRDEINYIKEAKKDLEIVYDGNGPKKLEGLKNTILILTPTVIADRELAKLDKQIGAFLKWPVLKNYKIFLRCSPRTSKLISSKLVSSFKDLYLDDASRPLLLSYEYLKPKFVVSWASTGLVQALHNGLLPISLSDEEDLDNDFAWTTIYPLRQRVMFWPRDKKQLFSLMNMPHEFNLALDGLLNDIKK